jgi:hypothetical protein
MGILPSVMKSGGAYSLGHCVHSFTKQLLLHSGSRNWKHSDYRSEGSQLRRYDMNAILRDLCRIAFVVWVSTRSDMSPI